MIEDSTGHTFSKKKKKKEWEIKKKAKIYNYKVFFVALLLRRVRL